MIDHICKICVPLLALRACYPSATLNEGIKEGKTFTVKDKYNGWQR